MSKQPSYYAILTADVRYDSRLSSSEKLFYAEVTALSNKTGQCWASNKYFAELYDVSKSTVSGWVRNLCEYGYFDVDYEYDGKQIKKRFISIKDSSGVHLFEQGYSENTKGGIQNIEQGYSENLKDNSTSNNTTSNNNYVQFVDLWNEVNECNKRITDSKRTQIRARLNTYTEEELKTAIRNRSEDSWINGEGKKFKANWDSFWRNDEKPERYLNAEQNNNGVISAGEW